MEREDNIKWPNNFSRGLFGGGGGYFFVSSYKKDIVRLYQKNPVCMGPLESSFINKIKTTTPFPLYYILSYSTYSGNHILTKYFILMNNLVLQGSRFH